MTTSSNTDKLMDLAEAVRRFVHPGATIHLGYGGARPNAAVAEIVRQFAGSDPGFTVSAHGFVSTQHALLQAGLVKHLCVAFAGENYPSPRPNPVLQRALADGSVTIENWSIWTLTARLMAAALGIPGMPVRSLSGSGLGAENAPERFRDLALFDGGATGVVAPLRPDIVLVQAIAADTEGNVLLAPPYGEGRWGAMAAATGVIACVERIVETDLMRSFNSWPVLPAHVVRAVCHTPMGSHPYSLWAGDFPGVESYVEDDAFMADARRAARTEESYAEWVGTWVTGVPDHAAYLALVAERYAPAKRVAATAGPAGTPTATADPIPITDEEYMTIVAARTIGERVRAAGHNSVLAGIGFAHLAAWTAAVDLRKHGIAVQLLAELGMAGFVPLPGDPYLFASQNLPTCTSLTDVIDVLGSTVSGPATSCLGVLGAGEVDAAGNLNSTWSTDGRFLVGSGGANDVASAANELIVVVKQDRARIVPEVGYITAPGTHVSTIVTTQAVFSRRADGFELSGWLGDPDLSRDEVTARIQEGTGWDNLAVAETLRYYPAPTATELATLRAFDPKSVFLRRRVPRPAEGVR